MRYIRSLNSQWFQKHQPSKLNNQKKSTKTDFFSIVQLWRLVFLEPLGVQRRYVPHFKGLISGKVELEAQGRDSTFTFHHALLKKAILLHKRAPICWLMSMCVPLHTVKTHGMSRHLDENQAWKSSFYYVKMGPDYVRGSNPGLSNSILTL